MTATFHVGDAIEVFSLSLCLEHRTWSEIEGECPMELGTGQCRFITGTLQVIPK